MGNTIIKAYKDNLNFPQTLPKLHFTVPSNFGKVYPSKNDSNFDSNFGKAAFYGPDELWQSFILSKNSFKLFQSCILPPFPNFAKVAFYGLLELWQSLSIQKLIQTFPKLYSTALHKLCQSCILRSCRTLAKFHPKFYPGHQHPLTSIPAFRQLPHKSRQSLIAVYIYNKHHLHSCCDIVWL